MENNRFYRDWVDSDLVSFTVKEAESDILILAEKDLLKEARLLVQEYRAEIRKYIKKNPGFETSLVPLAEDIEAPSIIGSMLKAACLAGVGPMAAVAGAISEFVAKGLLKSTGQVILENGGDIFIKTSAVRKVSIYAGKSPLSGKVSVKIEPDRAGVSLCTSSGTVGHSLSFGSADAVCVVAPNGALADAAATAVCNKVKTESDIKEALRFAKSIEGVFGAVVICGDRIGSIGDIELEV